MLRLILLISIAIKLSLSDVQTQPEQIHLSLGGNHHFSYSLLIQLRFALEVNQQEMIVTWVTFDSTPDSIVEYGTVASRLTLSAQGAITPFQDGGNEQRIIYIHRVVLTDLTPGQTYCD